MSRGPRYAVYWAPVPDDPLWRVGATWLGRDATGARIATGEMPDFPAAGDITEPPRLYGFHATLRPPMRLQPDVTRTDLLAALAQVTAGVPAFDLPPLAVSDWHGFLCLRETQPSVPLQACADAMVAGLDHLRAPLSDRELAHRRTHGLSPVREANLRRWGYPDVFATWFFHMTLSRRLAPSERAMVRPAAEAWFAPSLDLPRRVVDVCLFEQPARGADFVLTERIPLA